MSDRSLGECPPQSSLAVLLLSKSDPDDPSPEERDGGGAGELSPLEEPVDILRRHSRAFSGRNNELGADRVFSQSAELNREDNRSTGRPGRR